MALVENIVSLENEADSIVAQARTEAKEIEQSVAAEVEVYRRQLAEETEQKVSVFQRETEEKHKHSIAEAEKELAQVLDAVGQISGSVLREQIDRIITRFSEF
jgi:hypothetical protein